jgi:hypothetical protein
VVIVPEEPNKEMMQAYILNTDKLISPFMRPARQMRIHNVPLGTWLETTLHSLGCQAEWIDSIEQIRKFPALVVQDDLFATGSALKSFLQQARQAGGNHRAALESSLLTEHMVPALQGPLFAGACDKNVRVYDGYFLEQLDAAQPLDRQARLLPIAHRVRLRRFRTNRQFEASRRFSVPISSVYMTPIRHWASVLAANVLGMPGFFLHTARRRWLGVAFLPLLAACRSRSLFPGWWRTKTYLPGRNCNVAASAHVEASILGRRVRIEPQAVVRNSVLDDFVEVRAGAVVDGCSLGPGVVVETGSHLRGCVAEEAACIGTRFVQISMFGRECVVCPDSGITDFVLRGTVKIDVDGRKISSGSRYLGGCIGDNAFIGPNVGMPGGVEIPNGCQLIPNPRTAITDAQTGLPDDVWRVDRGRRRRAA